jgi:hypothetical protein
MLQSMVSWTKTYRRTRSFIMRMGAKHEILSRLSFYQVLSTRDRASMACQALSPVPELLALSLLADKRRWEIIECYSNAMPHFHCDFLASQQNTFHATVFWRRPSLWSIVSLQNSSRFDQFIWIRRGLVTRRSRLIHASWTLSTSILSIVVQ